MMPEDRPKDRPMPQLSPRIALIACLILSACGADGPPEAPTRGVGISGEVQMGVVLK
ncbi:hypothetical protein [Tabrizicola thermarum]|uniref:hypothetical protein n=1 Tax=Tabrizicola thermarum TaxID=2670345 RepID=UPI001EE45036|nr:hypothetical protein [Tabrizicola thermarum]